MSHHLRPSGRPWYRRLPRLSGWAWTAILAVLVALGILMVLLGREPDPTRNAYGAPKVPDVPVPAITTSATATPTVPPPTWPGQADLPENSVASGNAYLVGSDIPPGTYETSGAEDPDKALCFWAKERLSPNSSAVRTMITNGAEYGSMRVSLPQGVLFQTQGCKPWHRVS